jgi:hypothetical protein
MPPSNTVIKAMLVSFSIHGTFDWLVAKIKGCDLVRTRKCANFAENQTQDCVIVDETVIAVEFEQALGAMTNTLLVHDVPADASF